MDSTIIFLNAIIWNYVLWYLDEDMIVTMFLNQVIPVAENQNKKSSLTTYVKRRVMGEFHQTKEDGEHCIKTNLWQALRIPTVMLIWNH